MLICISSSYCHIATMYVYIRLYCTINTYNLSPSVELHFSKYHNTTIIISFHLVEVITCLEPMYEINENHTVALRFLVGRVAMVTRQCSS